MTRSRHQGKSSHTWRTLFEEQGARLTSVAEILLPHPVFPGQILDEVLTALEGSSPHGTPRRVSAIRAVVKAAVAHQLRTANPAIETGEPEPRETTIPWNPMHWHAAVAGACSVLPARCAALFPPRFRPATWHERFQYRSTLSVCVKTDPLFQQSILRPVTGCLGLTSRC